MKAIWVTCLHFGLSMAIYGQWIKKSGELNGILVSKGKAWVEVKEDELSVSRYLAPWIGESPSRGGGFDSKLLGTIDKLIVGNRVVMSWFWDGHLRVEKIKHLKPSKKSGVFFGTLLQKGDKWIDVKSEKNEKPWRFYAQWVGGLPEDGGSYKPSTIEYFNNFEINDIVRFHWTYDHRPRINRFIEQEDDTFIPFYKGSPVSDAKISTESTESISDPFDSVQPSTNPFDQIPVKSPFDQVAPLNPFDQIAPVNPFEESPDINQNPFDSIPKSEENNPFDELNNTKPPKIDSPNFNPFESPPEEQKVGDNPFENVPLPGNPFDAVE